MFLPFFFVILRLATQTEDWEVTSLLAVTAGAVDASDYVSRLLVNCTSQSIGLNGGQVSLRLVRDT